MFVRSHCMFSHSLHIDVINVDSFIYRMNEWMVSFAFHRSIQYLYTRTLAFTAMLAVRRLQFNLRFVAFAPCVHNLIPYSFFIVIVLLFTFHFILFILFCFVSVSFFPFCCACVFLLFELCCSPFGQRWCDATTACCKYF